MLCKVDFTLLESVPLDIYNLQAFEELYWVEVQ